MLLAVMFVGQSALGAQRWIQIGPINVQPSEFSKLIMIISLAHLLDKKSGHLDTFKDLIPIFVVCWCPVSVGLKQPDLGTSLVFLAILFGMLFIAGIPMKHLLLSPVLAWLLAPIFWDF